MKNFWKFGAWLFLVVLLVFLGACKYEIPELPGDVPPSDPPVVSEKPSLQLLGFNWETSGEVVPGQAVLMPAAALTGQVLAVTVNGEVLTFHSVYGNGREIWYAVHPAAYYGDVDIVVETAAALYRSSLEDSPPVVLPVGDTVEDGLYWGRHNGDRATWYFTKKMSEYPISLVVDVPGCYSGLQVINNGVRWVDPVSGLIVKQSDVAGRGLALITPASCKYKAATLSY